MEKSVLEQYLELREEIKDLHDRIDRDKRRLIKITGYPVPEVYQVKNMIKKRVAKLHILEDELQEAVSAVDDFIEQIPKSDLRQMFRLYYLDDMTWAAVAINMNYRFPNRRIKYTEDNCRIRHDRYLKDNLGKL